MRRGKSTSPGVIETAVGDALSSFCFYNVGALQQYTERQHGVLPSILISTALYSIMGLQFRANSNNPATMISQYAAGTGGNTLLSLALRFVAQAAGGVTGAETMRDDDTSGGGGRRTHHHLDRVAVAEVVITFMNSSFNLYLGSVEVAPSKKLLIEWMYTFIIIAAFQLTGADKMGISLNPAHKFGEDFVKRRITGEHFFLYWFCPFLGAILAGWTFRIFIKMRGVLRAIFSAFAWLRML